jgi:SAM-dependent methyltransferase
MILYGCLVFLSSFLLFVVQPAIAKQILPWFGGSAAVWATCMVFFQTMLVAGYAYSDWTTRFLTPKRQASLHMALLCACLFLMPVIPGAAWRPAGGENPGVRILGLLVTGVGLPYMMLATTSPLAQAWFARRFQKAIPYRLFALSNLASLAALLAYPFAIERWIPTATQLKIWSALFVVFALLCAMAAYYSMRRFVMGRVVQEKEESPPARRPAATRQLLWLALAAMGTFMMLAVTNHICQNVAAIPFLWIAPLSLYLLTFILSFDHPRWYCRPLFLALVALALPAMAGFSDSLNLSRLLLVFAVGLFAACMFCHGELSRLRPDPRHLTTYYLMISLGGALGGLAVCFGAPFFLRGYFEIQIGLLACALLLMFRARSYGWWAVALSAAVLITTGWYCRSAIEYQLSGTRVMQRNFYGAIRTWETGNPVPFRSLVHGGIMHGGQLLEPDEHLKPSSYFGPKSGIGRMFAALPSTPRRVGVIGLGAGSIAAYARGGDVFRFYELNPQVVGLAYSEFTFLPESEASISVILGDARLSLEREPDQQFDVLVMDAFAGESIPVHLLTREAMRTYMRHLKPDGVLAFQATNRYMNIGPVVELLARDYGLSAVLISDYASAESGSDYWLCSTDQILVTANHALLENGLIHPAASIIVVRPGMRVWTDDFSNLLQVLKFPGFGF